MNPTAASPYWAHDLPVLEAPYGEAPRPPHPSNGHGGGMMSPQPVVEDHQIHPGQMRPISAATGYAVSSDFVANDDGGGGGGGGGNGGMAPSPPMMMMGASNDGSGSSNHAIIGTGHHHYDQHHRQAQWPGGAAVAMQQMDNANQPPPPGNQQMQPNPYSPHMQQQQQHHHHHPMQSPYGNHLNAGGGGGYHQNNPNYNYSGGYFHDGHTGHPDDSSPHSRGSHGGSHKKRGGNYYNNNNNNNHRYRNKDQEEAQMQKLLFRNPALRAAYWRLKLSLATSTSTSSSASHNRRHPQDRANPYAARDMVNPTKAEAWLAAIGAAEAMAQKKAPKEESGGGGGGGGRGTGRRWNKKNQHRGHDYRGGGGLESKKGHHYSSNNNDDEGGGADKGDRPDATTTSNSGGGGGGSSGSNIDSKVLAAGYLKHLLHQLNDDKPYWDGPPRFQPTIPKWDEEGLHQAALIVENMPGTVMAGVGGGGGGGGEYYDEDDDPYMTPANHRGGRFGGGSGNNRYSVFGDDDDDDEDSSSGDDEVNYGAGCEDCDGDATDAKSAVHSGGSDTSSTGDLSEEEIVYRGDRTAKQRSKSKVSLDPNHAAQMATRRIVVRVLAALGDIHSLIGISHSQAKPIPRWVRGASQYAFAFRSLTIGQELLDGQYAQLLQAEEDEEDATAEEDGDGNAAAITTPRTKARLDRLKAALATDSEIIAVSLTSFVRNRDRYLNVAKSRIEFLQGRLFEDKESREEAYSGMGQERWENNPSPRCTYSEKRKKMERELRQAKEGSERVSKLNAEKKVESVGQHKTKTNSGDKAEIPGGVVVEV